MLGNWSLRFFSLIFCKHRHWTLQALITGRCSSGWALTVTSGLLLSLRFWPVRPSLLRCGLQPYYCFLSFIWFDKTSTFARVLVSGILNILITVLSCTCTLVYPSICDAWQVYSVSQIFFACVICDSFLDTSFDIS